MRALLRRAGPAAAVLAAAATVLAAAAAAALAPAAPASAAAAAPEVHPAPDAVLAQAPREVSVRFPGAAPSAAQLRVLGTDGTDHGEGPAQVAGDDVSRALPEALAPGTYTVIWADATETGSSAFTVWRGGPLPPAMIRAADGGPTQRPAGWGLALAIAATLAEGAVVVGAASAAPGRGVSGRTARAALAMAAAAACWATLHAAAAAGIPALAVLANPLGRALLVRGVSREALLAAAAALAALACARARLLSAALGAVGLGLAVQAVPAARASAGLVAVAAWAALVGCGLYAGAWPYALRAPARDPAPAARLCGLVLALGAGVPLLARWHPLHGVAAALVPAALAAGAALGHPGTRSRARLAAAICLTAASAWALAPALAAPAPFAGRRALPPVAGWAYHTQAEGAAGRTIQLEISPLQVGTDTLRVVDPGSRAAQIPLRLSSAAEPSVVRTALLWRVAPGTYEASSDALSLPGAWVADADGASFVLSVGGPPVAAACPLGLTGVSARVALLPAPAAALATDPGDGDVALAATAKGIYATADGGAHWAPVGGPPGATALAVGRYGEWYAGSASGLWVSADGGASWTHDPDVPGPVTALASPLYPAGAATWAVGDGEIYASVLRETPQGLVPGWRANGPAPAGLTALLVLPSGPAGQRVELVAADAAGIEESGDGGRRWATVGAQKATALARAGNGLWAAGPAGLWTAASATAAWGPVDYGGGGVHGLAAAGAQGQVVTLAVGGRGLVQSRDGGRSWTVLGCAQADVVAMTGSYAPGGASPGSGPLAYVAASTGEVLSLDAAATSP